ncbi:MULTISPECIES: AI-2E family transporter [unclassified Rhodanobacter]|uniref:AI-2E family transporter n=1 Tax=unclassified Rhodanobacter TaxID=2621553 RepID=UPI001BDF2CFE|nr:MULTISPECIES: AI-2E family transporter [unclassified Rhodanobacter]MBT2143799.1 AI-2E family transporter [Rhodanobacter sp. LX-99]MBT2147127.1 AI-2E family transporter [Rhodanobacter sp. LX-100]
MDSPLPALREPSPAIRYASYLLTAAALLLIVEIHLLPALLAGLLVFELVQAMVPLLGRRISGDRARVVVVAVLGAVVVGLLILLILGAISLFHSEIGNPQLLWQQQLMPLVEKARQQLPPILVNNLPDSVDDLRVGAIELARKHAATLQLAGKGAVRVFVHIIIGLVLGAIVALSRTRPAHQMGPLAGALSLRCQRLAEAFHNIVFAQIKISLINTLFTAIFLLGVLPLAGIHVPLAKTLVVVTFMVGLLPVIGNLISNTAIAIAGLSVSLGVGIAALVFLILIHKLEYFLNARIVGTQIRARAWELLVAMLLMEAAFGLPGVIAAPIYYAYLKSELEAEQLL